MTLKRRKILALIGGGTILAAAAAGGGFLATRTPHAALQPWAAAGGYDDPRKRVLSHALLAPSAHNLQPWRAALPGADRVILWRDRDRELPQTDPFARQLTISMGCFIEAMELAAAAEGFGLALDLFPEGEDGPVAVAQFLPGAGVPDPLFAQLQARRTCREPFEPRLPAADRLQVLAPHADIVTDPTLVADLRRLTQDAWRVEMLTPAAHGESMDLLRLGRREIEASPDGIAIGGALMEALILAGQLTHAGQRDPASAEFRQTMEMFSAALEATPAYAVITTGGNGRLDQIAAGRRWMRLALAAVGQGLALQPVSQALQEYPEMAAQYAKAHSLLAGPGETVQMLGRLGHGPQVGPSPRWPLEARLRDV